MFMAPDKIMRAMMASRKVGVKVWGMELSISRAFNYNNE